MRDCRRSQASPEESLRLQLVNIALDGVGVRLYDSWRHAIAVSALECIILIACTLSTNSKVS
jgi:hypothetical protein